MLTLEQYEDTNFRMFTTHFQEMCEFHHYLQELAKRKI